MFYSRTRAGFLYLCALFALGSAVLPAVAGEQAFLAADHRVYGPDEPIRLTYWLPAGAGAARLRVDPVVEPGRRVVAVEPIAPIELADRPGRALIPEVFGELPRGPRPFASVLEDLGRNAPLPAGLYRLRLEDEDGALASNEIRLRVLADAPETREVPLDEVLGIGMPSIRVVLAVRRDGRATTEDGDHAFAIYDALQASPHPEPRAFVVDGHDSEALRRARAVLADGDLPGSRARPGRPASVVFHAYGLGSDVQLTAVRWRGDTLEIRYRLVPRITELVEARFALIPLPALEPGTFRVDIQPEIDGRSMQMDVGRWIDRKVSRSFTLEVTR